MELRINKFSISKIIEIILILFILILITVQGIDLTDEGYLMSLWKYSNVKETYSVNLRFLGTILFGGSFFKLGLTNFFGFRLINILLLMGSFFVFSKIITNKFNIYHFIIYIVFLVGEMNSVIHYNSLSIFLLLASFYFLKKEYFSLSGIFIVLFFTVKVNNLLYVPFLFLALKLKPSSSVLKFLIGMLIGILILILNINWLVGFKEFEQAITEHISIITKFKDPNYNLFSIVKRYLKDWFSIFSMAALFLFIKLFVNKERIKIIFYSILFFIFIMKFKIILFLTLSFYALVHFRRSNFINQENFIFSLLIMILLPFGSAEGLDSVYYVSIIPGAVIILSNFENIIERILNQKKEKTYKTNIALLSVLFFYLLLSNSWFDGPRYKLLHKVEINNNVFFTKKEKTRIIKMLETDLNQLKLGSNREILFFESTPMFYFIFNQKPSFGQPWPHISAPQFLKDRLNYKNNIRVVVRFKGQPLGGEWEKADSAVSDTTAESTFARNPDHLKVLYGFLNRNKFKMKLNRELYEIWTSQGNDLN
jgi:hypothetical protein